MYIRRRFGFLQALVYILILFSAVTGACSTREKKDVIIFVNGDRMTCEIVNLSKGYLYVKLDYADGTVALDWLKIARVQSTQGFVVADKTGRRYSGIIQDGGQEQGNELVVSEPGKNWKLAKSEIVEIEQTDTSVVRNLHGSIDLGFNFAKQQSRAQYSLDSSLKYTRTKWSLGAEDQSSFSGGGDVSTFRNDLRLNYQQQLRTPRDFYLGTAEFLHNDEQQLALRTTVGGALGYYFLRTNNSFIGAAGGFVWNRENYSSSSSTGIPISESVEGIVGAQLSYFKFKRTNYLVDARL